WKDKFRIVKVTVDRRVEGSTDYPFPGRDVVRDIHVTDAGGAFRWNTTLTVEFNDEVDIVDAANANSMGAPAKIEALDWDRRIDRLDPMIYTVANTVGSGWDGPKKVLTLQLKS